MKSLNNLVVIAVIVMTSTIVMSQVGVTIQPDFFGIHQSQMPGCAGPTQFPVFTVQAKSFRLWATCGLNWNGIERAQDVYNYQNLDNVLSALKTANVNNVMMTMATVPPWISSNPTDTECDGSVIQPGLCNPPTDVNADGSGTDASWISFATNLLQHITDPTYLQTHQRINYYEVWNEFMRSDTIGVGWSCAPPHACAFRGTFAQILRMTQDFRCLVKGKSSDPVTGTKKTCGTSGFTKLAYDPTAIVAAGNSGPFQSGIPVMQNYLYCNSSPTPAMNCNYGSAGSLATDTINVHAYFGSAPEEMINNLGVERAMLSTTDLAKPYLVSEGSWGKNSGDGVSDKNLYPGMVLRWFLSLLISSAQVGDWFMWDGWTSGGYGGLWSPQQEAYPPLDCTTSSSTGGYFCTGKQGYDNAVNWLVGKTITALTCPPTSCQTTKRGTYTLTLSGANGYQAVLAWDSTPITISCPNVQCGTTPYTSPTWVGQWTDYSGTKHVGQPTQIGANPILLEYASQPSKITNLTVSVH